MKLITALIFATLPAFADPCPQIAGRYYCLTDDREPKLDILTIRQWKESAQPEVMNYQFDYRSVPGGGSIFQADSTGISDDWGWVSKCSKNKIVSVSVDGRYLSEIFIDGTDYVSRTNGIEAQRCTRKQ